jgi:radical SAM superfamily enzyme YgiQ (UPF0313 family)
MSSKNNIITLIRPPSITIAEGIHFTKGIPPIGLAYIAGSLKQNKIPFQIIDGIGEEINSLYKIKNTEFTLRGMTYEQILSKIDPETRIIGLSVMFTAEWSSHKILVKRIKEKFPKAFIFLGGEHASSTWKRILSTDNSVDACVVGEGDETIVELYKAIISGANFEDVPGLATRSEKGPQRKNLRKRIKEIDEFVVDWDQFPVEHYLAEKSGMNTLNLRAMPILASRGCPYQCTFCSSPTMWGTNYYTRKPENIVKEMIELKERFQVEHFDFTDLSTTVNRKWTKELCGLMINAGLDVSWQFGPGTRSEVFNEDVFNLFKDSNIYKISFAPESGSKETIKKIKKNINLDKMYESIKLAVRMKIHTKCQFIMGMPDQTVKEMIESSWFIIRLAWIGVDDLSIYVFSPYPGSEISQGLEDEGYDISDNDYANMVYTRINNTSMPETQVIKHSRLTLFIFTTFLMMVSYSINYLCHPSRVLLIFINLFKHKPRRTMEMLLYLKFLGEKENYHESELEL